MRTSWPYLTPFVPLLSHPIRSLGRIMMTSSSIMVIVFKEEHMLADVSAMISSELWRHCNHYFICFKAVYAMCSHSFLYSIVLNVRALTPCILTPSYFFDGTCHTTQSQTNRHPSINRNFRLRKPLPPSIRLLINYALTPSEGGSRTEQELGRVLGGGWSGDREGVRGRGGGRRGVYFYFNS